jgi:hypothetical protein
VSNKKIPADRLPTPIWRFDDRILSYAGNRVLNGLEVDRETGKPVAVHLYRGDGQTLFSERFALISAPSANDR